MNDNLLDFLKVFPSNIISNLEKYNIHNLEEVRIRVNKPIYIFESGIEKKLPYISTLEDLKVIFTRMSNFSAYAFEENIKCGYITLKGGNRVGICGRCVVENGKIKTIKDISSINIRFAKEALGCSNDVMEHVLEGNFVNNTIIISPPKCGKTTMLRDIAKNISNGFKNSQGKNVSLIDERNEIASCYMGMPQLDVGIRTDVLEGCPKASGIVMMVRSMAPEVIVCDEIGSEEDLNAIILAMNSGVRIITSIHGENIEDFYDKYIYKKSKEHSIFKKAIVLKNSVKKGIVDYIWDFSKDKKVYL